MATNVSSTQRRWQFVRYYLYDHRYKGNWEEAAIAAGYKRPPKRDDKKVLELIRREEGGRPEPGQRLTAKEATTKSLADLASEVADLAELPQEEIAGATSWKEMAERLQRTYEGIASGMVEATPTQRQAIEHVFNRAYGRPGLPEQEDTPSPVVLLPAMGDAAVMHVCPVCAYYVGLSREDVDAMLDTVDELLRKDDEDAPA
jgi:hypothetical protein